LFLLSKGVIFVFAAETARLINNIKKKVVDFILIECYINKVASERRRRWSL